MPRNASGTYTLPLPPVVPDTVIESVWANTTNDDVAQALTDSLDRYGRGSMVAPLRFVDGLVSAPGFAWQAETGTGFYRESAGVMSVAVLGAKVGQWSASGITMSAGKSLIAPSITVQGGAQGILNISTTTTFGAAGAALVSLNDPGGQGGYMGFGGIAESLELFNGRNGPVTFWTNGAARARALAAGGFEVIGGSTGSLIVSTTTAFSAGGAAVASFADTGGQGAYVGFGGISNQVDLFNGRNGATVFWTNGLTRMIIDAGGDAILPSNSPRLVHRAATSAGVTGASWTVLGLPDTYGRHVMDMDSGVMSIDAGYTGWGGILRIRTNGQDRMTVSSDGNITLNTLAGAGNRPVMVDSNGRLFT